MSKTSRPWKHQDGRGRLQRMCKMPTRNSKVFPGMTVEEGFPCNDSNWKLIWRNLIKQHM